MGVTVEIFGGLALLDEDDVEHVMSRKWHVSKQGYARSCLYIAGGGHHHQLMHRLVVGRTPNDGTKVDHKNRNRLDNRKENLRVTTDAGNAQNTGARHDRANASARTSRFRGVMWHRGRGKWRVLVTVNRKQHSGGYYDDELEAAFVAQRMRDELMPMALPDPELVKITTN